MIIENHILCLIGPSGVGKSTIANALPFPQVVSYRTRAARPGEVDGVDGHFVTKEEFQSKYTEMIAKTIYAGNYYGITQGELFELENSPMVYVVDDKGFFGLKENLGKIPGYKNVKVIGIFIDSDEDELAARMRQQGRSDEEIDVRLNRLALDYASKESMDYVVVNREGMLADSLNQILEILIKETWDI